MSTIEVDYEIIDALKEEASKIAESIKSLEENIVIIYKVNPDNLCATGILVSCLRGLRIGCHTIFIDNNTDLEERIKKIDYSTFIFIGFQASELPSKLLKNELKRIIIIEHKFSIDKRLKYSWDSFFILSLKERDIPENALSNAGLAYFISEGFCEDYTKYSGLALIGGLAKKQVDSNSQKLIGINRYILQEGKDEGILKETIGTKISGRESLPIHLALKYSINPYFPGLTGNEEACTSFVSRLGIAMKDQDGNWRTISSLTTEERKKLHDRILALLVEEKSEFRTESLIGPIYIITSETSKSQTRNAEEYLWLLEGACQIKKYGLALAVILGDRTNLYDELKRKLHNYHGNAAQVIERITKDSSIIENRNYYRIIENQEFFEVETAPLVLKALVESNIINIDLPLLLHLKEDKMNYLYIHDSPNQIKKGFIIFHIIQDFIKRKILSETSFRGETEFFRLILTDEDYTEFLAEFEKSLKYHHEGTKEEDSSEKES